MIEPLTPPGTPVQAPPADAVSRMSKGQEPPQAAAGVFDRVLAAAPHARDLLLYVHVPFCSSKCGFCDLVAEIPTRQLLAGQSVREAYAAAVCRQITNLAARLTGAGYGPRFAYWGGGTPSRLDPDDIRRIGGTLAGAFDLGRLVEYTFEVSPETITPEKLQAMRAIGVTRPSMGVQSMVDAELKRTGRAHSTRHVPAAVEMIRAAGFEAFNIDLIASMPGQTPDDLETSIRETIRLGAPHITLYVFRPDPRTRLGRQFAQADPMPINDVLEPYARARAQLAASGYRETTIGYFCAEPRFENRGDEYYFASLGDYMGFGAGAESVLGHHLLHTYDTRTHRFIEDPDYFDSCVPFSPAQIPYILGRLGLMLSTQIGLDFDRFEQRFGFRFESIEQHPAVRWALAYYRFCGAVFERTPQRLLVTPETRGRAYLTWRSRGLQAAAAAPTHANGAPDA